MAKIANIIKLVEMIAKVAPGDKDIDDDLMMIYHGMLQDVPDDVLKDAAMLHLSKPDTAWLPSPGELRALCKQASRLTPAVHCDEAMTLRGELTGEGYWGKLLKYDQHVAECEVCTEPQQNILPRIPQSINGIAKRLSA